MNNGAYSWLLLHACTYTKKRPSLLKMQHAAENE